MMKMMKTLERLVTATKDTTVNNHAVKYLDDVATTCYYTGRGRKVGTRGNVINKGEDKHVNGFTRAFRYHGNAICMVDDVNRLVILTNAGWNTCSTTRALNDYRRYFVAAGYQVIEEV